MLKVHALEADNSVQHRCTAHSRFRRSKSPSSVDLPVWYGEQVSTGDLSQIGKPWESTKNATKATTSYLLSTLGKIDIFSLREPSSSTLKWDPELLLPENCHENKTR